MKFFRNYQNQFLGQDGFGSIHPFICQDQVWNLQQQQIRESINGYTRYIKRPIRMKVRHKGRTSIHQITINPLSRVFISFFLLYPPPTHTKPFTLQSGKKLRIPISKQTQSVSQREWEQKMMKAKAFKGANVFMSRKLVPPEVFDKLHDALKQNGAQVFLCCDPSRSGPDDYHIISSPDHVFFIAIFFIFKFCLRFWVQFDLWGWILVCCRRNLRILWPKAAIYLVWLVFASVCVCVSVIMGFWFVRYL